MSKIQRFNQGHQTLRYTHRYKGAPVHTGPQRYPPDKHKLAKHEFEHMLELRIFRPSLRNCSSALNMVPKKTDNWHLSWLPSFETLYSQTATHSTDPGLHGTTIFCRVDLLRAYHQILVNPCDIVEPASRPSLATSRMKKAIRSPQHRSKFQRFIEEAIRDLTFRYEYSTSTNTVPLQYKVQAIRGFPHHSKQLCLIEFLCMIQFYHRFVLRLYMTHYSVTQLATSSFSGTALRTTASRMPKKLSRAQLCSHT